MCIGGTARGVHYSLAAACHAESNVVHANLDAATRVWECSVAPVPKRDTFSHSSLSYYARKRTGVGFSHAHARGRKRQSNDHISVPCVHGACPAPSLPLLNAFGITVCMCGFCALVCAAATLRDGLSFQPACFGPKRCARCAALRAQATVQNEGHSVTCICIKSLALCAHGRAQPLLKHTCGHGPMCCLGRLLGCSSTKSFMAEARANRSL